MTARPAHAPAPFFGPNLEADLIAGLAERGWVYAPKALEPELVAALRADALARDAAGATRAGRIGRARAEHREDAVRRARIAWLDGATPAQARFLEGCEALRVAINRALFAGLFEFEAHFAVYPEGGFYKRHLDAFARPAPGGEAGPAAALGAQAGRSRVISLVAYLNERWDEADGGRLAVWETCPIGPDGRADLAALDGVAPAAEIAPEPGALALMMSETIPHEVRPAFAPRIAIAGWFRVNASVGGVVDPLR